MNSAGRVNWRVPVVAWSSVGAAVTAVRYLADPDSTTADGVWIRVDGGAYLAIATDGYSYGPEVAHPLVAWFPGYPIAIRWFDRMVDGSLGGPVGAAVLVSFACGLASAVLFWVWSSGHLGERERRVALAALLAYTYGWYLYGTVYSDSMFLALSLGAFIAADRSRWRQAVLLAGAASGVRPVGVAVGVGVLVALLRHDEVIVRRATSRWASALAAPGRLDLRRLRARHLVLLLTSWWGVVAYSAYLGATWHRPLLWVDVQENWSQGPSAGPMTWFKLHMAARMIRLGEIDYVVSNLVQFAVLVVVIAAIPTMNRRLGVEYGAYVAVIATMLVLGTNELIGVGRYALSMFPAFAAVGIWMAPRRVAAWRGVAVSAISMLVLTALFTRGAYLT